jgi:tetratricopeptide (TPR) repeat protein
LVAVFLLPATLALGQEPRGALDALLGPDPGERGRREPSPRQEIQTSVAEPEPSPSPDPAGPVFAKPRSAPPSADEAGSADARIRDLYEEEIRSVGRGQQRPQVVRMFLAVANDPKVSVAETYALLRLAAQLSEDGNDAGLAETAIQAFAAGFTDVDAEARIILYLEKQVTQATVRHVEVALAANERLVANERFAEAVRAVDLAKRMLARVPAAEMTALRGRVEDAAAQTAALAQLAAAASKATSGPRGDLSEGASREAVGLYALWRGDWKKACEHLRKGGRPELKEAAEHEPGDDATPEAICKAAGLWWKVPPTAADGLAISHPVRTAIREHAASLYERALAAGLEGSLLRKEAEKRIAEVRPAAKPEQRPEMSTVLPELASVTFDRFAFDRIEDDRTEQWQRFQRATRMRRTEQFEYVTAVRALTAIRPQWCKLLSPTVRDVSLAERQEALDQVIRRDPQFSDAHLCGSYLHMLAGDETKAKSSLKTAVKLIDDDLAGQVFCVRQILDLAWAAVLVGEVETAKRINNAVLKKRFPNEPAVLQVQAMLYMAQDRPQFSDAIDKLKDALEKTAGEERGWIAASLAWIRAAAPLDSNLRMPEDAEKLADEAIELLEGRSWTAWRAKAELRASERNWAAALVCLERAENQAPLLYREQLARQRECYRSSRSYEIERKR